MQFELESCCAVVRDPWIVAVESASVTVVVRTLQVANAGAQLLDMRIPYNVTAGFIVSSGQKTWSR